KGYIKKVAIGVGMKRRRADICSSLLYRYSLAAKYQARGCELPALIHKNAIGFGTMSDAVQVMAGAVVQTGTHIEPAPIINTGALVGHDCIIGMGAHIAPGAVLCGGVTVGNCSLIGANATVLPGITIGSNVIVPAGTVVREDITQAVTAV